MNKKECNHKFIFSHWERFTGKEGTNYEHKAVVICEKCGEIRIKEVKN